MRNVILIALLILLQISIARAEGGEQTHRVNGECPPDVQDIQEKTKQEYAYNRSPTQNFAVLPSVPISPLVEHVPHTSPQTFVCVGKSLHYSSTLLFPLKNG